MKSKYIAINVSAIFKKNKTGVEWYAWQLLKYLAREWKKTDPTVILFVPNKTKNITNFQKINWRVKVLPGKFLWTQYHLLKFLKRYPPQVLFSPTYIAPRFLPPNIPTINVVHGLEGEYFPEFRSVKQIIAEHFMVKPALKKSSSLIAVSGHTKQDLHHFYNIPLAQIKAVLSGPGTLDDDYTPRSPSGDHASREGIKFLFLGGSRERKNLITALKIFLAIKKQLVGTQRAVYLYIAGNINQVNPAVKKIIQTESENIHLLGYISETDKKKRLEEAHFLLYPSYYEGFGFPVLEAQAFGAIPIVLKNSGLNEVGGKGIIELDPSLKNKSFGVELMKIIENPAKLKSLRQLGSENVKKYSWQSCAQKTRKILLNST